MRVAAGSALPSFIESVELPPTEMSDTSELDAPVATLMMDDVPFAMTKFVDGIGVEAES